MTCGAVNALRHHGGGRHLADALDRHPGLAGRRVVSATCQPGRLGAWSRADRRLDGERLPTPLRRIGRHDRPWRGHPGARDGSLDVGPGDDAVGPGRADGRQVDPEILGELAHRRGGQRRTRDGRRRGGHPPRPARSPTWHRRRARQAPASPTITTLGSSSADRRRPECSRPVWRPARQPSSRRSWRRPPRKTPPRRKIRELHRRRRPLRAQIHRRLPSGPQNPSPSPRYHLSGRRTPSQRHRRAPARHRDRCRC